MHIYISIYIYICITRSGVLLGGLAPTSFLQKGWRVLLTEMLLPPIARKRTACMIVRGYVRQTRIDEVELDEGFQPYELDEGFQPHHPPFRILAHEMSYPGRLVG